ncbi:acetyl-CoA synthetase [Clostridia bacterium]|nr:acetyl-CoA synthetase [Clostridia bacterium]
MHAMDAHWKKFAETGYDENGVLNKFRISAGENYNFGYDVIDEFAREDPEREALFWVDTKGGERSFTFRELSVYSNKAANLFLSKGIKKGDMVMLVLKRNYQFWAAIIGLMKIGAVAIPATHMLTAHDFLYRFRESDTKSVIATSDNPEIAVNCDKADRELGGVLTAKLVASCEKNGVPADTASGWEDFDKLLDAQPETLTRIPTSADEMMLLYFTSGTSGYPKMVAHNHRYGVAHFQTALWHNVKPRSRHLTIADTGWGKAAWGKLFGQMALGAAVFVYDYDKFVPGDILSLIARYKIETLCAPPTMFRFFIQEDLSKFDLSSLTYTTIAGEALEPEVYNKWLQFTGLKLMEGFGQTETTCMLANFPGMEPRPGSMGKPAPLYNIDLVDENGHSVPPGVTGTIVIRAEREKGVPGTVDGLFGGYYRNMELTDSCWQGGLYSTGDTAWKDEDGYYWYVGRIDDVIKSSGYRIGPFEVESVLSTHPAVVECAVTGVPDPVRGFAVKATVVLAKGYTGSDALTAELQEHVKKHTAPYKYPRIIEFVPSLPKTISGKIRRTEIRERDN